MKPEPARWRYSVWQAGGKPPRKGRWQPAREAAVRAGAKAGFGGFDVLTGEPWLDVLTRIERDPA